jgi:outer membrane immunogenic protein
MKTAVLGLAAFAALIGAPALAADLAVPVAPVPVWTWGGFYLGGNVGYGWDTSNYTTTDHQNPAGALETESYSAHGIVAGGQAGLRWQSGAWVFGFEGTLDASGIDATIGACGVGTGPLPCTNPPTRVAAGVSENRETAIRGLGSVTLQVGHAWGNALFYVKSGWGGADLRLTNSLTGSTCSPGFPSCATADVWANGGTVGAGLEYLVAPNISVGIEYDYFRLSASDTTVTSVTGRTSTFGGIRDDLSQVLFRANYHFNAAGPIVAKD